MREREEENRSGRHYFSRSTEEFAVWLHQADEAELAKALKEKKDNEVTRILNHYHSGCPVPGCRERIRKLFS